MHHIVIGDGVTAAEFVAQARLNAGDRLTIIGPNVRQLGTGLAFRIYPPDVPWRWAYLLNSHSGAVDREFAAWLRQNWAEVVTKMSGAQPDWLTAGKSYIESDDLEGLFAPRAMYGEFLALKAENSLQQQILKGVCVSKIAATVEQIDDRQGQFRLQLSDGKALVADRVDVATGGAQVRLLTDEGGSCYFSRLYGNEEGISELAKSGVNVICVGANASMLDCLRLLQSILPESEIKLGAISPCGCLPEPLLPKLPRRECNATLAKPEYANLESFLRDVDVAIMRERNLGYRMAELRPGFLKFFRQVPLKKLLPDKDQSRFAASSLDRRFRRGTRDSIMDFERLSQTGNTGLIQGTVHDISFSGHKVRIHYSNCRSNNSTMDAGLVINCSGVGGQINWSNQAQTIESKLINKHWLGVCRLTGGIKVAANLQSSKRGLFYLSPSVTEIGDEIQPFPLYDAEMLPLLVRRAVSR